MRFQQALVATALTPMVLIAMTAFGRTAAAQSSRQASRLVTTLVPMPPVGIRTGRLGFNRLAVFDDRPIAVDAELARLQWLEIRPVAAWRPLPIVRIDKRQIVPTAIASLPDGSLAVLDGGAAMLAIVQLGAAAEPAGPTLKVKASQALAGRPRDLCRQHTTLIIADEQDRAVRLYSTSLRPIGKWPFPSGWNDTLQALSLTGVRMVCVANPAHVILFRPLRDEVVAFRSDGTVAWRTRIPSFANVPVRHLRGTMYQTGEAGAQWDEVEAAADNHDQTIAVRIVRRRQGQPDATRELLMRTTDGHVLSTRDGLRVLLSGTGSRLEQADGGPMLIHHRMTP